MTLPFLVGDTILFANCVPIGYGVWPSFDWPAVRGAAWTISGLPLAGLHQDLGARLKDHAKLFQEATCEKGLAKKGQRRLWSVVDCLATLELWLCS